MCANKEEISFSSSTCENKKELKSHFFEWREERNYSWQSCRWPVEDAHGYVAKVGSCEASLLWILHEAFSNEQKAKQSRTYMVRNFVNDS
jgi:hypothetical protein